MMTQEDRDLLIRLDERTAKLVKVLDDNGQPGLISRTTRLETSVKSLHSNIVLLAWLCGLVVAAAGVIVAAVKKG